MRFLFWGPQFRPEYNMVKKIFERKDIDKIEFHFTLTPYFLIKIYSRFKYTGNVIKRYINRIMTKYNLLIDEDVIFVYNEPWYMLLSELNYVGYLRSKYARSFHVCMLSDSVVAQNLNIDRLKSVFDKVYIYDRNESVRLNIDYILPTYSKNFAVPEPGKETFDISFVGQAKNRLKDIVEMYDALTLVGFSCRFYIKYSQKKDIIKRPGIVYSNKFITEKEYFYSYIAPARCMLEIANPETNALTARVREAIMYDKKLISNNPYLKDDRYYDENMMYIYRKGTDLDIDKSFLSNNQHSYRYNEEFEPINMIKKISQDYIDAKKFDCRKKKIL